MHTQHTHTTVLSNVQNVDASVANMQHMLERPIPNMADVVVTAFAWLAYMHGVFPIDCSVSYGQTERERERERLRETVFLGIV